LVLFSVVFATKNSLNSSTGKWLRLAAPLLLLVLWFESPDWAYMDVFVIRFKMDSRIVKNSDAHRTGVLNFMTIVTLVSF